MENNWRKNYYNKANDLFERLMDEQPEETPAEAPEADTEEASAEESPPDEEEEKGQSTKVEVYYNNINKETQEVLMNALRESLNATEDDKIATGKIEEALSKEPLITLMADELVRKLKIEL
jgi:hypothetical protein